MTIKKTSKIQSNIIASKYIIHFNFYNFYKLYVFKILNFHIYTTFSYLILKNKSSNFENDRNFENNVK